MQAPENLRDHRADLAPNEFRPTYEDYDEVNTQVLTRCTRRSPINGEYNLLIEDIDSNVGEDPSAMDVDVHQGVISFAGLVSSSLPDLSWQHEHDWLRLVHCYNPWLDAKIKVRVYTPGMLNGLWAGRMFTYDAGRYRQISQEQTAPAELFDMRSDTYLRAFQTPVFMSLREHYCLPENLAIGWGQGVYDREADGLSNAYFPYGTEIFEDKVRE